MMDKLKKIIKPKLTFTNGFMFFLVLVNVLPILAPILQAAGFNLPAKVIYFIYSFMCHQMHWRSIHLYDHQCAWCARDMAIWGAILIVAVIIKTTHYKGINIIQLIPFTIPIALDGGIQTIATAFGAVDPGSTLYISNNLMRTITGSIFGIGLGSFLMPLVLSSDFVDLKKYGEIQLRKLTHLPIKIGINKLAIITFTIVMIGYIGLVQIWNHTSVDYKPSSFLDAEVKLPSSDDISTIVRRKNGACPVTIDPSDELTSNSALGLDCFFGNE